jgi:hypothetical protein
LHPTGKHFSELPSGTSCYYQYEEISVDGRRHFVNTRLPYNKMKEMFNDGRLQWLTK